MKSLGLFLTLVAFAVTPAGAGADPLPAQYSFNDLYRLTVGKPRAGLEAGAPQTEAPVRVALVQAVAAVEPRFTVRQFPTPGGWLLALAGLALAGWVAHRRLSYL